MSEFLKRFWKINRVPLLMLLAFHLGMLYAFAVMLFAVTGGVR